MRKFFVFIISLFLFLSTGLFSNNQVFAQCTIEKIQTVEPNPQPISSLKLDFGGELTLVTNEKGCLAIGTDYKVVAYPQIQGKALEDFYNRLGASRSITVIETAVESNEARSSDGHTLTIRLNFNDEGTTYNRILKPKDSGTWNMFVCLTLIDIKKCDELPVVGGTIIIQALTPTPTPTPAQAAGQPIIDPFQQEECTFRYPEDQKPITEILVTITDLDTVKTDTKQLYQWWWDTDNPGDKENIIEPIIDRNVINHPESPEYDETEPTFLVSTIWDLQQIEKEDWFKNEGHLYCVDILGKRFQANPRYPRLRRTGQNCIRLFFQPAKPTAEEAACSGDITPQPTSPLPPCENWTNLAGGKISKEEAAKTKDKICASIKTAVGEVNNDPFEFVKSIMGTLLGLAGGIAVILIIIAGYRLMASQGNPEAVQAAREQITSAIVGLVFVIFSLVILQVIGVDLLKIPGFGR